MKRSIFSFLLILLLLGARAFPSPLKIHHIDVGQGDAALIVSPTGVTMLIDAGNDGDGTAKVLPYLAAQGITYLNYIVCSHYHSDHLGGLDEVINAFGKSNIGKIYDRGGGYLPTSTAFTSYLSAAKATGKRDSVYLGLVVDLGGGVSIKCVATAGKVLSYGAVAGASGSENDLSIGWVMSYGTFQYFTGGDLGGENSAYADSETPLASVVGDVDVLKVNHHGSAYSTNQMFVNALKPEAAIILVGDGNSYSHPVQSILTRLVNAKCYVYQTETGTGGTIPTGKGAVANDNIVVTTEGGSYTVSYGTTVDTYPGDFTTGISEVHTPTSFTLQQNYPNPFNPSTTISYSLPERAYITLSVYNQLGQKVSTLFNGDKEAGQYSVTWNAGNMASGTYFYDLRSEKFSVVKKLLLLK
jgi:beta-lactamase superfamily II metal-dependent hydrolase